MNAPEPVDCVTEDPRWGSSEPAVARGVLAVLRHQGIDPAQAEVSVLLTDDARMQALNGTYRGKDAPTNVLSWPSEDLAPDTPGARPSRPAPDPGGLFALGDLAFGWETVQREADTPSVTRLGFADYLTRLAVHGTLHLLGYDHETPADALLMEAEEFAILAPMGLADPDEYRAEREALLEDIAATEPQKDGPSPDPAA